MAELARDAEPAPFDPAAEHDPATDTGPEVDHDQMALPPAGAEPPLGPTGGIGIVVDRDGQPDPVEQGVAQRLLTPGQVRREDDGGAISPDEPGGSDADGAHLAWAHLGDQVFDDTHDGALDDLR